MDAAHGTRKMYREHACRCPECRAWNAAQKREYDRRFKEANGISVTQKYRPGTTLYIESPCTSCGKVVSGATAAPVCSACRLRSKRGIYIRRTDRLAIYERDGWVCGICNTDVDADLPGHHKWGPTLDHITPRSLGGSDQPDNLRLAHRACNSRRGARVA